MTPALGRCRYGVMPKTTDGRPIPITCRKAINMRLPFDLLERMDAITKRTGVDRTAQVVGALQRFLPALEPRGGR